jgi:hypothetical protein
MSLIFLSGPITNTDRTVVLALAFGWIMSYRAETLRSGSAITGKVTGVPWVSPMSPSHR